MAAGQWVTSEFASLRKRLAPRPSKDKANDLHALLTSTGDAADVEPLLLAHGLRTVAGLACPHSSP